MSMFLCLPQSIKQSKYLEVLFMKYGNSVLNSKITYLNDEVDLDRMKCYTGVININDLPGLIKTLADHGEVIDKSASTFKTDGNLYFSVGDTIVINHYGLTGARETYTLTFVGGKFVDID